MHSTKAVDLDKSYWSAKSILARCHEVNEEFDKAVEWQRSALEDLANLEPSPAIQGHLQRLGVSLARFLVASGSYGEATQLATKVYNQIPQDGPAMRQLFHALKASESYPTMLDLAKDLHNQKGTRHDMTRFEEHLLTHSMDFGPMSKTNDAKDWFVSFIKCFATTCWVRQEYVSYINLALLKYKYINPVPNPEQDFELILKARSPDDVSKASSFKNVQRYAARHLSHMYLEGAISAQASGQELTRWTSKLQDLSNHNGQGLKGQVTSGDTIPSMIYGHWLRKYEKVDPSVWTLFFRFSINSALDLLEDDVPSNDQIALSNVGAFLLMAGDLFNAGAALAATMKGLEIVTAEPARIAELRKADNLRVMWNCDGDCRARKTQYKELHFCEDCWDTCFCENCIVLVREGRLPFRKCSPKHSFVKMYPVSEQMRDVAATFTEPDLKLEVRRDWLDEMRKRWKVDESK